MAEADRSLDVGPNTLARWVMQRQQERSRKTPSAKVLTPAQQRIQALEARVRLLKQPRLSISLTPMPECLPQTIEWFHGQGIDTFIGVAIGGARAAR